MFNDQMEAINKIVRNRVLWALRSATNLREQGLCPFCAKTVHYREFRDELSQKEYRISGLCQKCQDEFYGR